MDKPSKLWYLLPIVLGIIGGFWGTLIGLLIGISGGLIGYIAFRNKDKKIAKNLLVVGILSTGIFFLGHIASEFIFYYTVLSAQNQYYSIPKGAPTLEVSNPRLSLSTGILTLNITNKLSKADIISIQTINYSINGIDLSNVTFFHMECLYGCDSSGPMQNIGLGSNAEFVARPYTGDMHRTFRLNESSDVLKGLNVGDNFSGIVKIGFMFGTIKFFESPINGIIEK